MSEKGTPLSKGIKLSFVIPAHNEERLIRHCLVSILRDLENTECEAEIIVVDNASTDSTGASAGNHPGVQVIDEPRKGLVNARQAGFNKASGELVANIDADIMLPPGWIQTVLGEFDRDRDLVCLSGPFIYHDLSPWVQAAQRLFYGIAFFIYLVNRYVFRISSMAQGGNFVIKKAAFEEVGGFDLGIDFYGEDTDVARRLHKVGKVKFTFRLPVYASGRRLAEEGVLWTAAHYAVNYFWVSFFKRPITKSSTDIRLGKRT